MLDRDARLMIAILVTEPQLLDQRPVVREIVALEVGEEAPAGADHLEQAAATVMVLGVASGSDR